MTGRRGYRSTLRDEHARLTHERVVAAASDLFVADGYGATTIDAIAERAGVSRRTVFSAVGGKHTLLKLAFDRTLAGDDQPVPIAQRATWTQMMRLDDPTELLGAWIGLNARIAERIADLHHVVLVAADHDPDAAALAADTDRQRALGNLEIVARLDELAALRPGLGLAHAAAIADTLIDPGLYRRLVRTHRWPFPHYLVHVRYLAITTLLDTRHHQPPPTLHEDRPER